MNDMNWLADLPADRRCSPMACVIALVDLFVTDPSAAATYWLTQATLAVAGAARWRTSTRPSRATAYAASMVVTDPMGNLLASLRGAGDDGHARLLRSRYVGERDMLKGEFFTLALFVAARHHR